MKVTPPGLFVVKLDASGNVVWSNGFGAPGCGGSDDSAIAAMTVTSGNDVVLAGRYCGSINFGNGSIPSQMGSQDGFVALLGGGSGSATSGGGWSRVFGDGQQQSAVGVVAGGIFGEIEVVGEVSGVANLGTAETTVTSMGGTDIFLAKFLADGTPVSAVRFGDADEQYARSISADSSGNLYVAGTFKGTLSFGTGNVSTPKFTTNAYLVKFDSALAYQWSKTLGGDKFFGTVTDVAIDTSASIIVAGVYLGTIEIGSGPIPSKGTNGDIFLAKLLSGGGQPLWTKTFDGGPGLLFGRMKVTPDMEPVLTGLSSSTTNFGTGPLSPMGSNDGFIAKFAP
jgi:hypothetical protein